MLTNNAKAAGLTFLGILIAGALTVNQYEQQKELDALKQPVIIQAVATPTTIVASPSATIAPTTKPVVNKLLPKVTLIVTSPVVKK